MKVLVQVQSTIKLQLAATRSLNLFVFDASAMLPCYIVPIAEAKMPHSGHSLGDIAKYLDVSPAAHEIKRVLYLPTSGAD